MRLAEVTLQSGGSLLTGQLGKRIALQLGAVLSLGIVCGALYVLYHTLQTIRLGDVLDSFAALPGWSIALAFAVTLASYLVVTGYDVIALRHIGRPLPYWRAGLAGFLASAFGNNIGFALLTGGSVRYRIYSRAGLSGLEIAGITTLCALTTAVGMSVILAVSLVFGTGTVADSLFHVPVELRRTLGALVLAVMLVYLLVSARRPLSIRTSTWALRLPSASTALAQGTLATLDLLLVGTLIYVLLPGHGGTSFINFLGVFALAMMAGSASNVPGGLGVFETVLLLGLPEVAPAALLGSILLFRCAYYLSPLALAAILLATHEVLSQRTSIARIHGVAIDWLAEIGPQVMGVIIIFAGVLLLFSGSVPADPARLAWMIHTLPLWVIEVFHLLGAALGLALIILARGLSRRLNVAYRLSAIGLVLAIVSALLSGLNAEVAVLLALVLLVLLPTYREFSRRASLWSQGFTIEWLSTITAILAVTAWLGFFTHKHITYTHELLWSFAYTGEYARFLRSAVLAFVLTGAVTLVNLIRPYPQIELAGAEALERVRRIVRKGPDTRAQLALLGDKRILFSESGNAFIMYQVQGKSWISLGDPLGPVAERQRLLWSFRDLCDRYGGWPVFYLVDAASLSSYVDLGLSLIKIGDEARVRLDELSILNVASAELREMHQAVRAAGLGFKIARSREVPALLPELRAVSDAWLNHTGQAEQGFSRGYFDTDYVSHLPCALVRYRDRIIAFAVLWASRNKEELALDLMRYSPEAPAGVIDYLLVELMLGGKARGYRWFNLGIAPLSELESHPLAPLWHRVGKLMYRQSEHFQSIEGLRRYEEGFRPVWRPKYLASPGGFNLPRILRDIARLTARGRPEMG